MAFRNSGVSAGEGASSNNFWLRLYGEENRWLDEQKLPILEWCKRKQQS